MIDPNLPLDHQGTFDPGNDNDVVFCTDINCDCANVACEVHDFSDWDGVCSVCGEPE